MKSARASAAVLNMNGTPRRAIVILPVAGLFALGLALAGRPASSLAVTDEVATKLVVSTEPASSYTADDTNISVTVQIQNAEGDVVDTGPDSTALVTLALSGGTVGATLGGTASHNASAGVATFSGLYVRKVGAAYQLDASSGSLEGDSTTTFNITHGAATQLVVTGQPNASYTADNTITTIVTIEDAWGNTDIDDSSSSVSLALSGGNPLATLGGTNPQAASSGVATFNDLTVRKVGAAYQLDASSGSLEGDSTTSFNITPGALDHFTIASISTPQRAGTPFDVTATAWDAWDNEKTDYAGGALVAGATTATTLHAAPGYLNGSGDDVSPIYGAFPPGQWTTGTKTASVTAFVTESGRQLKVSDGGPSGTSNTFDVGPSEATRLDFSVASNDVASPFSFQPIDTKVGARTYSVCAPPAADANNPCALSPTSTPVKVLARDAYGNAARPTELTIRATLGVSPGTVSGVLATVTTGSDGVAAFPTIGPISSTPNPYFLTATKTTVPVTDPTAASTQSNTFNIVNDLAACDGNVCNNSAAQNDPNNQLERGYGRIRTTSDFFTTNTNVLLTTNFVPKGDFNGHCGFTASNNPVIGQGIDLKIQGIGIGTTAPGTDMLLIIPKDTLKFYGLTSRGTNSFNVCLGTLYIGSGSPSRPWLQKSSAKKGPLVVDSVPDGLRYWGTPADCGTTGLNASYDPCISLRTKQASAVQSYFGLTPTETAKIMKDSDFAIVVHKPFPWDGRGAVN